MNNFLSICYKALFFAVVLAVASPLGAQKLASAPIQGHTTPNSFKLWLLAKNADQVRMRLLDGDQVVKAKTVDVAGVAFWKDHAPITVEFTNLKPQQEYELEVALDGEVLEERYVFSTFPAELKEAYTFTVGSCALLVTGAWKILWSDKVKVFKTMATVDSDFMLWLGDNVYLLLGEWEKARRFQKKYTKVRTEPAINDFMRSRPNYAIWDDHDYGPDNCDGTFENKDATLANFQSFWPNPSFGTDETQGIFSHFKYQDSEFFLLDDRYHRIAANHQTMIGDAQMAWLKERLRASQATFKFVAHGSQVTNEANKYECMAQYPQKEELFDFIRDEKITGVIFLSGDRHFTELLKTKREGAYPLYEFTNSPLMSPVRKAVGKPGDPEFVNPQRESNTLVTERNFGTVTVNGPVEDRAVTFRCFDRHGLQLWERTLKASDLDF